MSHKNTSTRRWGGSGVQIIEPIPISSGRKEQIKNHLASCDISDLHPEFFKKLELIIGGFKIGKIIANESKPSNVRKNLGKTLKHAKALFNSLNNLDGNSKALVDEAGAWGTYYKGHIRGLHRSPNTGRGRVKMALCTLPLSDS
jgi:hypothetical protein